MNRRNFFGTMVGGLAAAAAVRTWPFRVYSFPKEVKTFWWKPEDIIGQSVYVTTADKANYFHVGDVLYLHPEQSKMANDLGLFRITEIESETTMTIQGLERRPWPL